VEHEFGDGHVLHVGTDLARCAPARPNSLTPTLAPRVARSLARFWKAKSFNQPIGTWNTGNVKNMIRMLADAQAFAQNIHGWKVSQLSCKSANEVDGLCPCHRFCAGASYLNDNGHKTREKLLPDFPDWKQCVRGCRNVGEAGRRR